MTIVDLFNSWPLIVKIAVGVIFVIWLLESLLLPFKLNMIIHTSKRIETLLEQFKGKIEGNKEITEDERKFLSFLINEIVRKGGEK